MGVKTVIFYCNWSTYPGLQMSRMGLEKADLDRKLVVSMCSGRVSPELIVQAFYHGAWGVMVAACPPDSCEHDGNYKTVGRIFLLKKMLQQLGYDPNRLKLEWIDKGEVQKFKKVTDVFVGEIGKLGPISA